MKDKIREICTFHDKDGTSGYLLDEQRFSKIFELLDNQKKAILDKIEKSKCDIPKKSKFKNVIDEFHNLLLLVGRTNYNKALEDIKSIINNL
jgi:hypothetical protein